MKEHEANKRDSVVIDPVQMGITNRITQGSKSAGKVDFNGGLMLEGSHSGELIVRGPTLVVAEGASLSGTVEVFGDVYVFGRIGSAEQDTVMTVHGVVHLTGTSETSARLRCAQLATYDGAKINGAVETLSAGEAS